MESIIRDFHSAVKENDYDRVQQFLKEGINPDEPNWNNNGRPAIIEATYHGHAAIVRALLQAHADPNVQNMLGETALHNAFRPTTFSRETVTLLLDHGADVNAREKLNGLTAVHVAVKFCCTSGKAASSRRQDVLEVLRLLCRKADVTVTSTRAESPLHRLASGGADWTEPLQVLLEAGYEPDAWNDRGETALVCAVDRGHCAVAGMLLDRGAGVNVRDRNRQTALHHCVQKNLVGLAGRLLECRKCDVNATDLNGDTALHIAASKGLSDMVRVLLSDARVDVTAQNSRGSTALLAAVESGFTGVVELLLKRYLETDSEKCLLTALDVAEEGFVRRWHPEIQCLLQEALEQRRDLWDEGETSL